MGRTHKQNREELEGIKEKIKMVSKSPQPSQTEIAPLFSRKTKGQADPLKLVPTRSNREEHTAGATGAMRVQGDSESEGEGDSGDIYAKIANLPTKTEIREMLLEVTIPIREDIKGIKQDIADLAERTDDLEDKVRELQANQKSIYAKIQEQEKKMADISRKMEDQENRNRRKNIRIRGVPESIQNEDIKTFLQQIFNNILNKDKDKVTEIQIERAHRIQKPNRVPQDEPRDILCCLMSYAIKEEILRKAKEVDNIIYEDNTIIFYQDLAKSTLWKRKALKPVTEVLRERKILYRWGFPFSLRVQKEGTWAILRTPLDLDNFLKKLGLPEIKLTNWPEENYQHWGLNWSDQKDWTKITESRKVSPLKAN
ncbi:golgin subfamily A member 6-like protein 22 isoform X1 [Xenopus laevis]|uniref:Golgin subfamily A member 6-like protein 22 isoform X1 n=1 Tax=Xenopus laevis TaxID=8355 RepID=A0A8J1MKH4_XENLA|nr:golgin subfamily A member 6-like protein 22 isoform X1 [Xenopus laevis]